MYSVCLYLCTVFLKQGLDPKIKKFGLLLDSNPGPSAYHWPKITVSTIPNHRRTIWFYKNGWTRRLFDPSVWTVKYGIWSLFISLNCQFFSPTSCKKLSSLQKQKRMLHFLNPDQWNRWWICPRTPTSFSPRPKYNTLSLQSSLTSRCYSTLWWSNLTFLVCACRCMYSSALACSVVTMV